MAFDASDSPPARAMIDAHFILKLAHVIGACVLFGTGMGIAFFMWMARRGADLSAVPSALAL